MFFVGIHSRHGEGRSHLCAIGMRHPLKASLRGTKQPLRDRCTPCILQTCIFVRQSSEIASYLAKKWLRCAIGMRHPLKASLRGTKQSLRDRCTPCILQTCIFVRHSSKIAPFLAKTWWAIAVSPRITLSHNTTIKHDTVYLSIKYKNVRPLLSKGYK